MGPRKNFIRIQENFVCEFCKAEVRGNGYTNHCPNCLFSKHIDKNIPGDRDSFCQGLMEPVGVEIKAGKYTLIHKCQNCVKVSKNKTEENDNFEKIIELSRNHI